MISKFLRILELQPRISKVFLDHLLPHGEVVSLLAFGSVSGACMAFVASEECSNFVHSVVETGLNFSDIKLRIIHVYLFFVCLVCLCWPLAPSVAREWPPWRQRSEVTSYTLWQKQS